MKHSMKERNSGIDLLKCVAMMMIVMLHILRKGGYCLMSHIILRSILLHGFYMEVFFVV